MRSAGTHIWTDQAGRAMTGARVAARIQVGEWGLLKERGAWMGDSKRGYREQAGGSARGAGLQGAGRGTCQGVG